MAPEMWDEPRFWFCLKHHAVESDQDRCKSDQRLGPFKTSAEAAAALELARKRNEDWESDDDN